MKCIKTKKKINKQLQQTTTTTNKQKTKKQQNPQCFIWFVTTARNSPF